MPPKTAMPSTVSTGASGSSFAPRASAPPMNVFTSDSIRQLAGVVTSIPPKSAWTEAGAARELGVAQVDVDAAEPGQHRAATEGLRAARELDAVQDRDERELVALGVAARAHDALEERRGDHHAEERSELEEQEPSKQTHRARLSGFVPRLAGPDQVGLRPYAAPIRVSCPAHSFSRSTNFCTLPVEVFGSGPNSTASGHL